MNKYNDSLNIKLIVSSRKQQSIKIFIDLCIINESLILTIKMNLKQINIYCFYLKYREFYEESF